MIVTEPDYSATGRWDYDQRLDTVPTAAKDEAVTTGDSRSWIACPICGEPDMRAEGGLIECTNLECVSNGGHNDTALSPPPSMLREFDDVSDPVADRAAVVDDLLAQCVRINDELDLLDTKLTVMYGEYRKAMNDAFTPTEQRTLRLGITREMVTLEPDECNQDHFGFTYHDYDNARESTRLPVAWLLDPEAFIVAKRSELPVIRATSKHEQMEAARRQLARAQELVDRLTAEGATEGEL